MIKAQMADKQHHQEDHFGEDLDLEDGDLFASDMEDLEY